MKFRTTRSPATSPRTIAGIGPAQIISASVPARSPPIGPERLQNVADYRIYSDRIHASASPVATTEPLSNEMKRAEQIALSLRTRWGVPAAWLEPWPAERAEFMELELLRAEADHFFLTEKGKLLADTVAAAFV